MTKFDFRKLEAFEADRPVKISVPKDGGGFEEQVLVVRFRLLTQEQEEQFDGDPDRLKKELRLAIVGLGADEEKLTPELLEKMLHTRFVRLALLRAYGEFASGEPAKN